LKKRAALIPNIEILFGARDENLKAIQKALNIGIELQEDGIQLSGPPKSIHRIQQLFADYQHATEAVAKEGGKIEEVDLKSMLQTVLADPNASLLKLAMAGKKRAAHAMRQVQPKTKNQADYMAAIETNDMVFGIGPAGTGKTYLAVAMAVSALLAKKVKRLIFARPAVEAGEKLGFLPGTMQEKVDPYMRPIYDALYEMVSAERVDTLIEKNVIEIAPVAFMRGRTLSDAFVILDEAQNTTPEQMKMLVTRLGNNSKMVITGDITQIDLAKGVSGLVEAVKVLKGVEGIAFQNFEEVDVVRHALVQRVVNAYAKYRAPIFVTGMNTVPVPGNGDYVNVGPLNMPSLDLTQTFMHYLECPARSGGTCTCRRLVQQ
jgi:phosphate starvation-inducible PhoH-like protein